ncbi:hypothetical protein KKG61_07400 [bacterium]|nr:hypothetical protein [bacterium]
MLRKTLIVSLGMVLGLGLVAGRGLAIAKIEPAKVVEEKGTEAKDKAGTLSLTEIEPLGPTKAVSSIMQGLGRVGEKHKVLFIEVLEENYDTFLPGLMSRRLTASPYFRFDKRKNKVVIDPQVLQWYSPNMLNAQGEMKEKVCLVVKHTLDYKGIGRTYPKYYIYEVSQVPATINLIEPPESELWDPVDMEKVRFVDNLKILNLSSEREIGFIYGKERITLGCEKLWKAKKKTKVFSVEDVVGFAKDESRKEFVKEWFDRLLSEKEIDNTIKTWGIGSEKDIGALKERKITFSTEVTIFNHGIVEIETYKLRRSK